MCYDLHVMISKVAAILAAAAIEGALKPLHLPCIPTRQLYSLTSGLFVLRVTRNYLVSNITLKRIYLLLVLPFVSSSDSRPFLLGFQV